MKRVILITGTPSVGKTTIAQNLASKLNAAYVNLTELAEKEHLTLSKDKKRDTKIIDETKMRQTLTQIIIQTGANDIIIDGHYAAAVTAPSLTTHVFVLRRNPQQLRTLMQERGFSQSKQDENIAAEILDVCLVEALRTQPKERVCELDVTEKNVEEVVKEMLLILDGKNKGNIGIVDWLGTLEREGKLSEYLKI
ncbi:MAG: adenylate kinase family protein [Candidatus Bathyarchaeota archaeon]|nr:adenylate kinase family protein [Candidatus Bathyarchaeota archaeon]